jgi:hypothetical protein
MCKVPKAKLKEAHAKVKKESEDFLSSIKEANDVFDANSIAKNGLNTT